MSTDKKKPYRPRRLFPRTLDEVVKQATKPLMDKQGKLYSALLRDWATIVGKERGAVTRPQRLQFPTTEASGATLHLAVRPAAAPEFAYITEQLLDQFARYFGYRAITRIVLHPTHGVFDADPATSAPSQIQAPTSPVTQDTPTAIQDVLNRIGQHLASPVVKKNETR
jgi:hypothetical protein